MPTTKPDVLKIPKSLAAAADLYDQLKESRLALQKQVDAIEANEKRVRQHLIDTFRESETTKGVTGLRVQVTYEVKNEPTAENWDEVWKYLKRTGNFQILNRSLNKKAVKEIWDAKKAVPGVGSFPVESLSVHKIK